MDARSVASKTLVQTAVIATVALLMLLVLRAADVFLLFFAGILLAVLFHNSARWVHQRSGLPQSWALVLTLLAPLLGLAAASWLAAPEIVAQTGELAKRLPSSVGELQRQMQQHEWVDHVMQYEDRLRKALPSGSEAAGVAAGFFTSTFGALGNLLVAFVIGLFLAASPSIYVNGAIRLVPPAKRARARQVLEETSSALASWLMAKIVAMAVIGALTTVGLWLIGIDLALVLGLIAALLSFIPNIGPIVAVIPALLIALVGGIDQGMYVLVLYIGVQAFESYLLTPLLQQRVLDLPPALLIGAQLLCGVLAGILGVILATPLMAATIVMVRMWYIEDTLGDRCNADDANQYEAQNA